MADISTIEIQGGESASILVEASSSVSAVVSQKTSYSLTVSPNSGTSVDVSVSSASVEVSTSAPNIVTTVSERFNQIEVAAAIPAVGKFRLRDLQDIKGDPESGQVLVYNQGENNFQFQDQNEGGDGGDDLIDEAITVTNGDFETLLGGTYETGTTITQVLKNILDPYKYPKFTSFRLQMDDGSNVVLDGGDSKVFEVGRDVDVENFSFVIDTPSDITADSVALRVNGADHQSGVDEEASGFQAISPAISYDYSTPTTVKFSVRAKEEGNPNGIVSNIDSKEITLNWYYKTILSVGTTDPTDSAEATTLSVSTQDSALAADPGEGSIVLECSSAAENVDNFTYLLIPEYFGTLKSVVQNSAFDVTADFFQVGGEGTTWTVTNSNGLGVAYYIYRTNDAGAFVDGNTLTIKFN